MATRALVCSSLVSVTLSFTLVSLNPSNWSFACNPSGVSTVFPYALCEYPLGEFSIMFPLSTRQTYPINSTCKINSSMANSWKYVICKLLLNYFTKMLRIQACDFGLCLNFHFAIKRKECHPKRTEKKNKCHPNRKRNLSAIEGGQKRSINVIARLQEYNFKSRP
jgi:hypothetical protein